MQEHSKEDSLANGADMAERLADEHPLEAPMGDSETLEYVADECERLERLCRGFCQPLAGLLMIAAWIAIQVNIARRG